MHLESSTRRSPVAIKQHGINAPFAVLAETAFREIVYDLPYPFDRRTVFPLSAGGPIRTHLVARGWRPEASSGFRVASSESA